MLLGAREGEDPASRAGRLLRGALAQAQALGMTPLASRAAQRQRELEAAGLRAGPFDLHLTARELEVLAGAAEGESNQGIAERLGISANTVANHLHRVLAKTGAGTRLEAAAVARRLGVLR